MPEAARMVDVRVDNLVYGGDAMGRLPDGRAIFVPYSLPGETVRARIVEEKKGFVRADLVEVLEASPLRQPPRCGHYTACGGCHYQHMPYPTQLEAKTAILIEQLERIGGLENPPMQPIVPSPKKWNYRNNVQLHLSPDGKLGFQEPRSNRVIPIEECPLAEPPLDEIWRSLEIEPQPGLERISLRLGADEDVMLVLESSTPETPELNVEELPVSVVHLSPAGTIVLAGSDYITIEVLGRPFKVSAGSFFQVNTAMAEKMVAHLLEHLPLNEQTIVLELYSGAGLFSAFLASRVERLAAVESAPSSVEDFVENLDEFDNVEVYEAPVEEALPAITTRPDIVLADPPRSGLGHRVVEEIVRLSPQMLAYVSCDPATLARDARDLVKGGYSLRQITPFDMFPQTYHIETISLWGKKET